MSKVHRLEHAGKTWCGRILREPADLGTLEEMTVPAAPNPSGKRGNGVAEFLRISTGAFSCEGCRSRQAKLQSGKTEASPQQILILTNLLAGRPAEHGLDARSVQARTVGRSIQACIDRKWITESRIVTDAGKAQIPKVAKQEKAA